MDLKRQASAPLYEAIEKFRKKRIVPFDVPGHKRGRGNPELVDLLGERCVGIDVNSMKHLITCATLFLLLRRQRSLQQKHLEQNTHFLW